MIPRLPVVVRPAKPEDDAAIWSLLEPTLRAADTYALPPTWSPAEALDFWCAPGHHVWVAEGEGKTVGTYYLHPNQRGGGAHVANCGYITDPNQRGRGVARAMCRHSLIEAARHGFRAMQFNFVVSTNVSAIAVWQDLGFEIVGRLPGAFAHPREGYTDALVMFRSLVEDARQGVAAYVANKEG